MGKEQNLLPFQVGLKWNIISSFLVSTLIYAILCLVSVCFFGLPLVFLIQETSMLYALVFLSCFSMNFFLDLCLTLDEKKKNKKEEHSDDQPQSV